VATVWIAAGSEGVHRQSANLWPKLNHTHIRCPGDSVETFLSRRWTRIEGEDTTITSADARDRKTGTRITELFVFAFITALEPIDITPFNFPGAELLFQCIECFSQCGGASWRHQRALRGSVNTISPAIEYSHCD